MEELEIKNDVEELLKLEKQADDFLLKFNKKWNGEGISATLSNNHKNHSRLEHKLCVADTKQTKFGNIFKKYYSELKPKQ